MPTSGRCIRTLGVDTLIDYGSSRKLWVLLELDARDEEIRHVFIHGGNCCLVLVIEVGGRFRVSATSQSFGALDFSFEITT